MREISVFDAKTHLSRFLEELASGRSPGFVITRHGKPVARLTAETAPSQSQRLGVANGKFAVPDSIDDRAYDAAALFGIEVDK